jgi:hypothetical protein
MNVHFDLDISLLGTYILKKNGKNIIKKILAKLSEILNTDLL